MFVNPQQRVRRRATSGLDIRIGMQRTTRTLRGPRRSRCIAPCVSSQREDETCGRKSASLDYIKGVNAGLQEQRCTTGNDRMRAPKRAR